MPNGRSPHRSLLASLPVLRVGLLAGLGLAPVGSGLVQAQTPRPSRPMAGHRIPARGASKAEVRIHTASDQRMDLHARNLTPGTYAVLLGEACPVAPLPPDVRSGKVDPRNRSGASPEDLGTPTVQVGSLTVSDRTEETASLVLPAAALGEDTRWTRLMVREVNVSPSLSDAFGLVACGRRPTAPRADARSPQAAEGDSAVPMAATPGSATRPPLPRR